MIAEIIVNSSVNELNRTFDYEVPEEYTIGENIDIGYRVLVSFANRKSFDIGYIIGFKERSDFKCKKISKVCDRAFDNEKFMLAKRMARRYFCNLSDILKLLVPPGTVNNVDKIKPKKERCIRLTQNFKDNESNFKIKTEKQKKVVDFLKDNVEMPVFILVDVTGTTMAVIKSLEEKGVCESFYVQVSRNPFVNKNIKKSFPLPLTDEQKEVISKVELDKTQTYLIHGVTGSGKTEVYLQIIDKVLNEGKNAIVLVPEISLTPQITDRFLSRFGRVVAILHSKLSGGERYDEWHRIMNHEARIVIGARSALFAPIENVGVIIIDEEHDSSYKSETTPKYDAREVANEFSKIYNCPLILGSATPDIRTYYKAVTEKSIILLELKNRISSFGMPTVNIVDMRNELANGNKSVFSESLFKAIQNNVARKEQTMLFLNRRGYSTFIMCRDCGYVVKCDKCDVAMTYHITKNLLLCHYCGAEKKNVSICPSCKSNNIRYFGTGTQKIELQINKTFPNASVIRMDVDTTQTKNAHETILQKFKDEKIDILLGTQMITKGHDFENVTLVGVLAADSSLNIGDYRAQERTFQLLTQVCGRSGRGEKLGKAIIQTYMPDEFSIQCAKDGDYIKFYNEEIKVREKLNYPPFCDIIIAVISGGDEAEVSKDAKLLFDIMNADFETFKPMPAPISKINDNFRWRILVKAKVTDDVIDKLNYCLENFSNMKSNDTKISFDINSNNMV